MDVGAADDDWILILSTEQCQLSACIVVEKFVSEGGSSAQ